MQELKFCQEEPGVVSSCYNDILGAKLDLLTNSSVIIFLQLGPDFYLPGGTLQTWFLGIIHFWRILRIIPSTHSLCIVLACLEMLEERSCFGAVGGKCLFEFFSSALSKSVDLIMSVSSSVKVKMHVGEERGEDAGIIRRAVYSGPGTAEHSPYTIS